MKNANCFSGLYKGQDIWVVGSGATMDYVNPSFFNNKVTIGLNYAFSRFPNLSFYLTYHHDLLPDAKKARVQAPFVCPCFDQGLGTLGNISEDESYPDNYYYFDHEIRSTDNPRSIDPPEGMVAMGVTVATSGMSFAKLLGASNIILCGIDGGGIDDASNFDEYYEKNERPNYMIYQPELIRVANVLRTKGINVVSLNPFIGLYLEGHSFNYDPEWYMDDRIHNREVICDGFTLERIKRQRGQK